MSGMKKLRTLSVFATLAFITTAHAQLPAPPTTTEDALRQMLAQSAIAFTGQVTALRHTGQIAEIDFAVDDAILGVTPNATYTLRQWTGLTPNSNSAFQIGSRYLMFLHAPGPGGLSSPVGGPDGAIPILPGSAPALPNTPDTFGLAAQTAITQSTQQATSAASLRSPARSNLRLAPPSAETAPAPVANQPANPLASATIDLRWIAAHVLTPVSYASDDATPQDTGATAHLIFRSVESDATLSTPAAAQTRTTSANYSTLLTTLRTWHREDRAAH